MKTLSFVCFEGEGKEGETKTFTQEEVNSFLAKEKRKTQEAQKQLATQLEDAKKNVKLSIEDRGELEKQIEELQTKYMTTEERARQASEKTAEAHITELQTVTDARDTWQQRFTAATIDVEIAKAAVTNKAISTEQIAALLRPDTKLAEKITEEGTPSGTFEPRVAFNDTDKSGASVTLDLSVPEAVKRMTELEQYGNLFEGNKTGGLGAKGSTGKRTGEIDIAKIARDDPAQYRKLRKERPDLFAKM